MPPTSTAHELACLVRSFQPIVVIETVEEERVDELLAVVASDLRLPYDLLVEEMAATVPLSVSRREDIERIRETARGRFVSVK